MCCSRVWPEGGDEGYRSEFKSYSDFKLNNVLVAGCCFLVRVPCGWVLLFTPQSEDTSTDDGKEVNVVINVV